ncbi:MAG TPA: adenylate/guanylate cyclase domain-containing protein [Candidatus Binataceae bacterium]|nr:adenylate/guanylate cyclase domain-containing protein [Candidatus Binataceae bacterium]
MRCPSCGTDNSDRSKFCAQCGAQLRRACPGCGFENSPGARFCVECGTSVSDIAAPSATPEGAADGERRHLTVLFCDLVNSTEIASHIDPEEWHQIAAQYQRTAADAVERAGGHVAKYLGDGLMVYFGWPEAHEDDAQRAVRAGLAIVEAVAELNKKLAASHNVKLAVRVGIDAGSVVVGHAGGAEADVFGHTPNIASRVQGAAAPDSVFITDAVHQLVSGAFELDDRGAHQLKGVAEPVQLHRVIAPVAARRRTYRDDARAVTPFVGRDEELRLVLSRWERARQGEGQIVLAVGEPGIGKSRLVEEFRARVANVPHIWIECAGEQFFQSTPFHAVTQILAQSLGWSGGEPDERRINDLERSMEAAGMKVSEAVPLIAEMLNLAVGEKYSPLMFAADQKRRRLLANLAMWILSLARSQPLVIVIEDLQWADPSTLELSQMLVDHGATASILLLFTARPEFRAPWPARAHHSQIMLSRLSDRETREMVAGVAARHALDLNVIEAVVKRTDGVPLFAEELTRLMLERRGRSAAHEIPATLHDSLEARLDRLGRAKEVAQIAAVIGRDFSYELLAAVASIPETQLQSALLKLADAELIYARGIPPEATYQFKHALIQDAAYEALLKTRRKEMHRRVAQTIVEKFPAMASARGETIARHWTDAGEAELAVAAWKDASQGAEARGAYREAEQNLRQALADLATLPESPERDARELKLVLPLLWLLQRAWGYAARETVEMLGRARALAEKTGSTGDIFRQGFSAWAAAYAAGDHAASAALADQMMDLVEREGTEQERGLAYNSQVTVRLYRGDMAGAEEYFERFDACIESIGPRKLAGVLSNVYGFSSIGLWATGRIDAARARAVRGVALSKESHNPYDEAFARWFESWFHCFLREPRLTQEAANESLVICEERGFSYCRDLARFSIGWAVAHLGDTSEGLKSMREALDSLAELGARVGFTELLTQLAEVQALDGRLEDALASIENALAANPEELIYQPDILRCRGDLRIRTGQQDAAEADFREAIRLAREMNTKCWEIRAATSLARLLASRQDRAGARELLNPVYNWFTDGLDTADLKAARSMLDQLN